MSEFTLTIKTRFDVEDIVYPVYYVRRKSLLGAPYSGLATIAPRVIRKICIIMGSSVPRLKGETTILHSIFYFLHSDEEHGPINEEFVFATQEEAQEKYKAMPVAVTELKLSDQLYLMGLG